MQAVYVEKPLPSAEFSAALQSLPEEKRNRIGRMLRVEDAQRVLLGELLIRTMLSARLRLPPNRFRFRLDDYGKPHLQGEEGIHFNLSHSGSWITCAVHDTSVGVDLEQIRPIDLTIAQRYFCREEYEDLLRLPEPDRYNYFFALWTCKESYVKAVGKGLSIPLNAFAIRIEDGGRIQMSESSDRNSWHFRSYEVDPAYKLTVCAATPDFPEWPGIGFAEPLVERYTRLIET